MILDPFKMTLSDGKATWGPPARLWKLIVAMSSQPERVWERDTLLAVMGSEASHPTNVDTQIKQIRAVFKLLGWSNPITTRHGLGYAWMLPIEKAPADHAPAAGADEFRFKRTST